MAKGTKPSPTTISTHGYSRPQTQAVWETSKADMSRQPGKAGLALLPIKAVVEKSKRAKLETSPIAG